MIAIVDYGAGNLQSVKKALDFIGAKPIITGNAAEIASASHVILPGVGSFGDAMHCMEKSGLVEAVRGAALSGRPFLGICLGMHLLFSGSEESPGVAGLGVLPGKIVKIPDSPGQKVPHMGWNSLHLTQTEGIFRGVPEDSYVYFVHSYYLQAERPEDVAATTEYAVNIHAAVQRGNLCATQFHPEKSSDVGLQLLRNFVAMKGE